MIELAKLSHRVVEDVDFTVGAGVDTVVAGVVGMLPTRKAAGLTQYSSQLLSEMLYQSLSETLKMTSRSHNARWKGKNFLGLATSRNLTSSHPFQP